MSNYPAQIDTSATLPIIADNSTPVRADTVNRLRSAIIAIESELGVKPSSVYATVRARLDNLEGIIAGLEIIDLDADLGGTLEDPLVIGIQGRPVSTATPVFGSIYVWNGIAWAPTIISTEGGIILGGDLAGSFASQTVIGIQNNPVADTTPLDGYFIIWNQSTTQWEPGYAGTVTATADELVLRDGYGSTAVNILTAQRVTGDSADLTLAALTGNEVNLTINNIDVLSVSSTAVKVHPNSLTFDVASTIAPTVSVSAVGKALTIAAGQANGSNIGGALTLAGGVGGTPGTNLSGNTIIGLGQTVGGSTAKLLFESTAGTQSMVYQQVSSGRVIRLGTGDPLSGNTGLADGYIESGILTLNGSGEFAVKMSTLGAYCPKNAYTSAGVKTSEELTSVTTITSATTTNVRSYALPTETIVRIHTVLVISNDTDNEGASMEMCATFKNRSGTVTQVGTTLSAPVDADAGQTGLVGNITFSGTNVLVTLVTPSGDTVNVNETSTFYLRVAA